MSTQLAFDYFPTYIYKDKWYHWHENMRDTSGPFDTEEEALKSLGEHQTWARETKARSAS